MRKTLWPSLMISTLIVAVLALLPLQARIDPGFFFAQDSAALEEVRIQEKRFGSQELLMVIARSSAIDSPAYDQRIAALTEALGTVPGIITVRSLANGPDDLADARESPIWNRLLLYPDSQASNLILVLDSAAPAAQRVPEVQALLDQHQAENFELLQTGVPYVVHSIGSELQREFRRLGGLALAVFAVLLALLYRNPALVLGSLMACAAAATAALCFQVALNGGLGLLTANLITIAFVLTLLHAVFLINNVRRAARDADDAEVAVRDGRRQTIPVSAWCTLTTLLGFASLMMVDAQPLRELGKAGVATTLAALASAYLILPLYLPAAIRRERPAASAGPSRWQLAPTALAVALLLLAWALGTGVGRLNTDPSMLDYFADSSPVHRGLAFVDARSGTNPLNISVSWRPREALDNRQGYERMWALQRALQAHPQVGTVVSLPVLMAEADRSTLASLLPWNWILDLLNSEALDRVAAPFVTADRGEAMYMLRMVEEARVQRRSEVIADIHQLIRAQGFAPVTTGGLYALQAKLADAVSRSLVEGLGLLLLLFFGVAWLISRHAGAAVAMGLCAISVPLASLGLLGWWGMPLDIIATPAASVALGVASDALLHLAADWRRARADGQGSAAARALQSQGPSIAAGALIIGAGFAVFLFSAFPPTQRFGIAVLLGTVIAAIMALWVLPTALRLWDVSASGGARIRRSS